MCLNPITLTQKRVTYDNFKGRQVLHVPCGKCAECAAQQQNGWYLRFLEESKNWKTLLFVTYEYVNDTMHWKRLGDLVDFNTSQFGLLKKLLNQVPANRFKAYHAANPSKYNEYMFSDRLNEDTLIPDFDKSDLQRHFKRVRSNFEYKYNRRFDFKYFIQGERGPNTLRPHYHALIWTNEPYELVKSLFADDWFLYHKTDISNHIELARNRGAVGSYCSKYVVKPQELEDPYVRSSILLKAPRIMSKGIGRKYRDDFATKERCTTVANSEDMEYIKKHFFTYYVNIKGKLLAYSKPRYWTDKLKPHVKQIKRTITEVRLKTGELKYRIKYSYCSIVDSYSKFADRWRDYMGLLRTEKLYNRLFGARTQNPLHAFSYVSTLERIELFDREVSVWRKHLKFYETGALRCQF